jgi:hypothetical protein
MTWYDWSLVLATAGTQEQATFRTFISFLSINLDRNKEQEN